MGLSAEQIARVCSIAHETRRGAGKSLRDAIDESGYLDLRGSLTDAMLADHIAEHPELVEQWSMYSANKRTLGGWYFLCDDGAWIVRRLGSDGRRMDECQYPSAAVTCACFILAELDFWVSMRSS